MDFYPPYLLFLGDAPDRLAAKTAIGVAEWRPDACVGQVRLPGCHADLGLDDLTIAQARDRGVRTLIVGLANRGGVVGGAWLDTLVAAAEAGMDIASGLHGRLGAIPRLAEAARQNGTRLFDVRHPPDDLPIATGRRRAGLRVLTVGTDCSVGKMYTSLALEKAMKARGLDADFRATGQTGIFIAGGGIAVDAVVADFISGAAEVLSPEASPEHWDIIEGQGSLFHASYAGVSLGLLHGSQPDWLVLCHEPERPHMRGLPGVPLPDMAACLEANLASGRLTNPDVRLAGIACNTSGLDAERRAATLAGLADRFGVPAVDPILDGADAIVDRLT